MPRRLLRNAEIVVDEWRYVAEAAADAASPLIVTLAQWQLEPDTWLARFRGRDEKQQYRSLGEALEFDDAKKRAEDWLSQLAGSPVRVVKRDLVIAALETYLTDLRRHGRVLAPAAIGVLLPAH